MRKYVLEMNEEQAELTSKALEFYARVRAGQYGEVADLCLDMKDADFTQKRNAMVALLNQARKVAYPRLMLSECHSYGIGRFDDSTKAWELHTVLRHRMAWTNHPEGGMTVNFDPPMSFSGNELAKCDVKNDDK